MNTDEYRGAFCIGCGAPVSCAGDCCELCQRSNKADHRCAMPPTVLSNCTFQSRPAVADESIAAPQQRLVSKQASFIARLASEMQGDGTPADDYEDELSPISDGTSQSFGSTPCLPNGQATHNNDGSSEGTHPHLLSPLLDDTAHSFVGNYADGLDREERDRVDFDPTTLLWCLFVAIVVFFVCQAAVHMIH